MRVDNSALLSKLEELVFQLDLKATEASQLRSERDSSREELAEATTSAIGACSLRGNQVPAGAGGCPEEIGQIRF